jgi:hypothetical protein
MNKTTAALTALFNRIPRRHSTDNVKEINWILNGLEEQLMAIESENDYYEKKVNSFFEELEKIRFTIKKSNDNKASKKNKDDLFDEASVALKDCVQALLELYNDGNGGH